MLQRWTDQGFVPRAQVLWLWHRVVDVDSCSRVAWNALSAVNRDQQPCLCLQNYWARMEHWLQHQLCPHDRACRELWMDRMG